MSRSEQPLWTEGICGDGAAILRDGVMVPIEEVVRALNRGAVVCAAWKRMARSVDYRLPTHAQCG